MKVKKRTGQVVDFNFSKIKNAIVNAAKSINIDLTDKVEEKDFIEPLHTCEDCTVTVEEIQDVVEKWLMKNYPNVAKEYILYREKHRILRDFVKSKTDFIEAYKKSSNTANATVDDNSNVGNKNIGILNNEIHKTDNIQISRGMVMHKLKELYPDFDCKQYIKDLESHIIYKHDESSFAGAIAPYCCSITMYPFLTGGIKGIGGLSAAPKNLDSFCGMYINLIFATSSQFAGAVATSEFLLYFTYFCKKEWGNDFWQNSDKVITQNTNREKTIKSQIHQYWQQIIYSINQPAAARGMQAAFVNFSYFDKPFFEGMFGDFMFPDGTKPDWESLQWVQKEFMQWFNQERLRCLMTFPVESFALVYKDGAFVDQDSADFVAAEYARGHSFFTYISDTVDSLSSCCFSKDQKILWKSSTSGVNLTTFEELYNLPYDNNKENIKFFHNGSWIKGKLVKLPGKKMFKVTTFNNKEIIVTEDHINPTFDGDKPTDELTTNDYLLFNNVALQGVTENSEHLTYAQGYAVGAFLGDGSFGSEINGIIYDINYSQNVNKVDDCVKYVNQANKDCGDDNECKLNKVYNNVYPIRISSKKLVAFIMKWTNWFRGTYSYNKKLNLNCLLQSYEFRKGILDGWYNTDGGNSNRCYTTSKELAENMEVLIISLGLNSIVNISDRTDEKVIIRGEEYNRNYPLYCIKWYEPGIHRKNKDVNNSWKKKNNSIYFKIKTIEPVEYDDFVYCIDTQNLDEPYFTLPNGIITHNCRLRNMITTKEFNFTNGNMGVQTGSKSVITLNLNRIIQDWYKNTLRFADLSPLIKLLDYSSLADYLNTILERVYKYHNAYNELLWDMYNADLLPVYKAGFIDLNKQYLTIGINGLNEAAEFMNFDCTKNGEYAKFCQTLFNIIKEANKAHAVTKGHKMTFNTECVPAESLAIKNYNWDKKDGYWVPQNRNLYASYIFIPSDNRVSVLDRIVMHGKNYIGEALDGGSACHINLAEHLSEQQYKHILEFAAKNGCQYFTFNIPNCECDDCGFIAKQPFEACPKCGSTKVSLYDRPIGYLTKIKNWSEGRQIEQKTRVYSK